MKNKVLLINSPNYDSDDKRRLRPLGICSLAATLRNHGYQCDVFDPNSFNTIIPINDIVDLIQKTDYDVIGISAVTPNFHHAVQLAQNIKLHSRAAIVLGGIHATFLHDRILQTYDCFDVIIRGEGEFALIALVEDWCKNRCFTYPVDGCSYKTLNQKSVFSEKILKLETLNDLPAPIQDNIFNYSYTLVNGKLLKNVSLITSRGCPYECVFCSVTSFRRKWITREADEIISEILTIYEKDPDIFVVFVDDNFFINRERALYIVESLTKACGEPINFCFSTRTDIIVRHGMDAINILKKNGCFSIELGVENGCDAVLKRMAKKNTVATNKQALQMLNKAGILVGVDYILFDPWTTITELEENIAFLKDTHLWGYYPPLVYIRMLPYPGTKLSALMNMTYSHNSPLTNYFIEPKLEELYNMMIRFKREFQDDIDAIMDTFKTSAKNEFLPDVIRLKMLPYLFLEKALNIQYDSSLSYDTIVRQLNVRDTLKRFKETTL